MKENHFPITFELKKINSLQRPDFSTQTSKFQVTTTQKGTMHDKMKQVANCYKWHS